LLFIQVRKWLNNVTILLVLFLEFFFNNRLDKDDIIDATKIGGMSRFINHCCEPNAYAKVLAYENNDTKETEKHIVIFAAKNIQVSENVLLISFFVFLIVSLLFFLFWCLLLGRRRDHLRLQVSH
jgi:hypothetical protein